MALDVKVIIIRDGIIQNSGNSPGGGEDQNVTTAVLGVAKLGEMILGEE